MEHQPQRHCIRLLAGVTGRHACSQDVSSSMVGPGSFSVCTSALHFRVSQSRRVDRTTEPLRMVCRVDRRWHRLADSLRCYQGPDSPESDFLQLLRGWWSYVVVIRRLHRVAGAILRRDGDARFLVSSISWQLRISSEHRFRAPRRCLLPLGFVVPTFVIRLHCGRFDLALRDSRVDGKSLELHSFSRRLQCYRDIAMAILRFWIARCFAAVRAHFGLASRHVGRLGTQIMKS